MTEDRRKDLRARTLSRAATWQPKHVVGYTQSILSKIDHLGHMQVEAKTSHVINSAAKSKMSGAMGVGVKYIFFRQT